MYRVLALDSVSESEGDGSQLPTMEAMESIMGVTVSIWVGDFSSAATRTGFDRESSESSM